MCSHHSPCRFCSQFLKRHLRWRRLGRKCWPKWPQKWLYLSWIELTKATLTWCVVSPKASTATVLVSRVFTASFANVNESLGPALSFTTVGVNVQRRCSFCWDIFSSLAQNYHPSQLLDKNPTGF